MRRAGPLLAAAAAGLALVGGPPALAVDDPGAPLQWGMARIGAPGASVAGRGAGVVVAIVDTGVDPRHEDLAGRVLPGRDLVADDDVADDEEGHGTHVAGIVAAAAGNGLGVAGVAPDASILPVRVLDAAGRGTLEDVAAGIRWATEAGADVINLSLGPERGDLTPHPTSDAALRESIDAAWAAGAVVVLAAGNDDALQLSTSSPALVVAATDRADEPATYAGAGDNDLAGARFALSAPGGEAGDTPASCAAGPAGILSTYLAGPDRGSYACLAGTSMAAPHVAGAAALLRGLGLDHEATRSRLLATAVDLGAPGPDPVFGAGRLDVGAAVAGLAPTGPATGAVPPTAVAPTAPPAPGATATAAAPPVVGAVVPPTSVPSDDGLARVGGAVRAPAAPGGDEVGGAPPALVAGAAVLLAGVAAALVARRRRTAPPA